MDLFYHYMNYTSNGIIDVACCKAFKRKSVEEVKQLIEDLAKCNYRVCDAPFPGGSLTTRQPEEYKWMSGYPTPLQKIRQSRLCTGSSTQIQHLQETCPKQSNIITT